MYSLRKTLTTLCATPVVALVLTKPVAAQVAPAADFPIAWLSGGIGAGYSDAGTYARNGIMFHSLVGASLRVAPKLAVTASGYGLNLILANGADNSLVNDTRSTPPNMFGAFGGISFLSNDGGRSRLGSVITLGAGPFEPMNPHYPLPGHIGYVASYEFPNDVLRLGDWITNFKVIYIPESNRRSQVHIGLTANVRLFAPHLK